MNLLGIGPFELLLVLVIATIVLGPERMAQAGRTLGRLYAQYRIRWQRDVDEMTRELRRELALLQQEVEEIRQTAESEIRAAQAELEDALDTEIMLDIPTIDGKTEQASVSSSPEENDGVETATQVPETTSAEIEPGEEEK